MFLDLYSLVGNAYFPSEIINSIIFTLKSVPVW